ncbi:phosphoadenylyl-sulfate reductase [Maricaulis sp.]|uniref:phosphoadenylyl-sulfate reductase n=1 Tax=Maricaulis sp. TaxID=1486257 RepID=UPI00262C835C|nr:phosphoadenylyl-sulfate reductase [Maricaulis sp.]
MLQLERKPLARETAQNQIEAGGGHVVEIPGESDWRDAAEQVRDAVQVDIRFSSFKDGRGFTLATQLRERAGFTGRLRAVGDLIPDQARYLHRVGFDDVAPERTDLAADWAKARARFSHAYQPAQDKVTPIFRHRQARPGDDLAALNARYRGADAADILRDAIRNEWAGRIAVLSSFGAEAAVGLHMIARIAPDTPVIFLDTGRLFAQTEQYQRALTETLGLTNIRMLRPDAGEAAAEDGDDRLWQRDPDACCALRKVRPLDKVIGEYDALITGRKRFHGGERLALPVVERINGRIRVNPLASWDAEKVNAYFQRFDLPRHPLSDMGYASIGCWPCTAPVQDDGDVRSGRWAGRNKTECGIHTPSRIAAE